nr:asparagine synthase-related protein [Vibrio sp. Isolate33]
MHEYDADKKGFVIRSIPKHDNKTLAPENVANSLRCLLKEEAISFLEGKSSVGILLSGGMDSRIVAGILRELQNQGLYTGRIVALTWGAKGTRDVVYAERISKLFCWDFVHFELDAETLYNNITLTAERGAEYSPLHLHAMHNISTTRGLDGVLAGSYGDSIGRAEYSGQHVTKIKSVLSIDFNKFDLLNRKAFQSSESNILEINKVFKAKFDRKAPWQEYELERQGHYMRRQLGACMDVIDDNIPLYQMFTASPVVELMWSLTPLVRSNDIYTKLLASLPGNLLTIPWARNGKIYPNIGLELDSFESSHNHYGKWLRQDCSTDVLNLIFDGTIENTGLFNMQALKLISNSWLQNKALVSDRLDEKFSWLASFSIFSNRYNLQYTEGHAKTCDPYSSIFALKGKAYTELYLAYKHRLKRV